MGLSRRSFLGGALSLGALAGCRAFRSPAGALSGDGARLVFGAISDIHVDAAPGDYRKFGDTVQFEKTLRWFDAQGADGVLLAGDMADNGLITQLQAVGDAWFRVFPDGRSTRDGRKVEQLFVYGNHDFEGQRYDKFDVRYHDTESFERAWIRKDPAKAWESAFREPYAPIWTKTVKGYRFVGAHWKDCKEAWDGIPEVEPWFRDHADLIDPTKPFFFVQHCHPKDTVYGGDAWCPDKGYATRALSAFPNAVAFSGHSHASLTDERSVWQGAFTSVGTSSLRYGGDVDKYGQRQGMLVKVYDDRIAIVRRDFLNDASLGDDWIVPLPVATTKPFAFATRAKSSPPPQFAAGARLAVVRGEKGWTVTIPCADAAVTRAFRYEIATGLEDQDGKPVVFTVPDAKYNLPRSMSGAPTEFLVADEALPKDAEDRPLAPSVAVTPLDCFGNRGRTLSAT